MKSVSLKVHPRSQVRRTGLKQVRSNARVPAVIYGGQNKPENLEIDTKELENLIHHSASENVLVDVSLSGSADRLALVQDVQHHVLSGKILHVDLHEVSPTEKVVITVPVESSGVPVGVKVGGGVLEHVLFKLKVRGLPKDLPEVIVADVTNLEIGKSLHIGEIQAPEGVEILGDKKIVILSVAAPLTEAAEAAADAAAPGAGAQPEMIKEKKEEGAAPAADAKKGAEKKAPEKKAEKK